MCHPSDLAWFTDDRILPQLPRSSGPDGLRLAPDPGIGPGLALLDAPDIDSVVSTNRELASTLLAAADLWVFLTTAARYADAVPWQMLHTARDRGTAIAIVLNRCPPEAMRDVAAHLSDMLAANGLGSAPLFVIAEQGLRAGRLRIRRPHPSRSWLAGLTADSEQRAAVVRYTLDGALAACRHGRTRWPMRPTNSSRCARSWSLRVVGIRQRARAGGRGGPRRRAAARRGAGPLAGRRRHGGVPTQIGVAGGADPRPGGGGGNRAVHSDRGARRGVGDRHRDRDSGRGRGGG